MTLTPIEAGRMMQAYAKQFAAGAFATPTNKELSANPGMLRQSPGAVGVIKRLTRDSHRTDWTGREFLVPAGADVVTHLARQPGAPLPDWARAADYVQTYREDRQLTDQMREAGKSLVATRITAASEIIGVWGPAGGEWRESPIDQLNLAAWTDSHPAMTPWPESVRRAVLGELAAVDAWHDDFPFYSDGTWDAVSLRGYDRDDPTWGVKPIEMGRKWHAEHPGAIDRVCEWTVLADLCPTTRMVVESVRWWGELERVRFMRMRARPDGRPSLLNRHSDITDRTCGTRRGQMVRFMVPLVTNPTVEMTIWTLDGQQLRTHLPEWRVTYFDARKPHAVVNPSGAERVQLAVDVIVDDELRRQLAAVAS
jgi:hypothetical protein